ncbi:MAG: helix-turn-helix domain-containing protein [Paludibacteraceae bacterium]|nr:helix-turn-helix domain-containing protein [Paludibacteraceae bacterium]
MKVDEVPQDLKYFQNTVMRDVTYAVDENGNYTSVLSDGWSVKNDALELTMDNIYEGCEEIRQRVLAGETSLLEYYAAKNIMDIDLLSDYTGISKRNIRKHFDPKVFAQLDQKTLEKYADVLRITVEELTTMPE